MKNGKTIVFTKDYATKSKGDEWTCDSMLASSLVHSRKVAHYKGDKPKAKRNKTETKEK